MPSSEKFECADGRHRTSTVRILSEAGCTTGCVRHSVDGEGTVSRMTGTAVADRLPELAEVPDSAPPYDCGQHGITCQEAGLASIRSFAPPSQATRVRTLPPEPRTATATAVRGDQTCAGTMWPRQFAQAIIETLAGLRPARQLTGWCTDQAQARIQALVPLLRTDRRPVIVRVLAFQPASDVAEVTVIATFGARTRALAMRFEHRPSRPTGPGLPQRPARWLCTVIESG